MNIGFLYYDFYPVKGGASVHGYNLAKELSTKGFNLFKINGAKDPITTKYKNRFIGFLKILMKCELLYIRIDYFVKFRNLALLVALLFRKKIVVELNSPSDELKLYGKSDFYIRLVDRLMSFFLKRVNAIIVVSNPIKKYCIHALGLDSEKIHVVENGGQVFNDELINVNESVKLRMKEIRDRYRKIAVWAGSPNKMQDIGILKLLSEEKPSDTGIVAIFKSEKRKSVDLNLENIFVFTNISRNDVSFIIRAADIGLAFYDDYNWSRWGFYNSSLKIYEFLNNDLLTISNKKGSKTQKKYQNFHYAETQDEILKILRLDLQNERFHHEVRTWEEVGTEVTAILKSVSKS